MQGASSVCGQAARSPLIPPSPLSRHSRASRRSGGAHDYCRKGACSNLAYLVPRSPRRSPEHVRRRKKLRENKLTVGTLALPRVSSLLPLRETMRLKLPTVTLAPIFVRASE